MDGDASSSSLGQAVNPQIFLERLQTIRKHLGLDESRAGEPADSGVPADQADTTADVTLQVRQIISKYRTSYRATLFSLIKLNTFCINDPVRFQIPLFTELFQGKTEGRRAGTQVKSFPEWIIGLETALGQDQEFSEITLLRRFHNQPDCLTRQKCLDHLHLQR